jgi:hypothetical protein
MIRYRSYLINSLCLRVDSDLVFTRSWLTVSADNSFFRKPLYLKYFYRKYFVLSIWLIRIWYRTNIKFKRIFKIMFFLKWDFNLILINYDTMDFFYKFNSVFFVYMCDLQIVFYVATLCRINVLILPHLSERIHSKYKLNNFVSLMSKLLSFNKNFKFFKITIDNLWIFKSNLYLHWFLISPPYFLWSAPFSIQNVKLFKSEPVNNLLKTPLPNHFNYDSVVCQLCWGELVRIFLLKLLIFNVSYIRNLLSKLIVNTLICV